MKAMVLNQLCRLVINAIGKEDGDQDERMRLEKEIKRVANVSRRDVSNFLSLAAEMGIKPGFQEYALEEPNQNLVKLKTRKICGAKVLRVDATE